MSSRSSTRTDRIPAPGDCRAAWCSPARGGEAPVRQAHTGVGVEEGLRPRLGIAYTLTPKTVVRTGYGIFIPRCSILAGAAASRKMASLPFPALGDSTEGLSPAFLLQSGLPQTFTRPPFIDASYLNGQNGPLYRPFDSNRRPYAQQWNFTIERQLTNNSYFNVAYVGNKGTRLPSQTVPINADRSEVPVDGASTV